MDIAVLTAVYQVRMVGKRVVSVMFEDKYTVVCQQTITDDGSKQPETKKGSSGGGCDAGVSGWTLALGAAFLLRKKA